MREPTNRQLVDNYMNSLDEVMTDFRDMIAKDKKDALEITVNAMKR